MATTNKAFKVKSGLIVEGSSFYPAAGTTTYAPIVLTSGTNLTTAAAGSFEFDGTNFYLTPSTTRKTIAFTDSVLTSSVFLGTTSVALNRSSGSLSLAGVSIDGAAGSVSSSFAIKADTGTTEGTDLYTFNGSAAKTLNIVGGSNITITKTAGQWSIAASGGGTGSVTSVSVVSANGFAGTVANATSTPAITLTTSITGLLKGNGTAISAAVAGTDYVVPSGSITGSAGSVANALTFGTGLTASVGSSPWNGSAAATIALGTAYGDTTNPYGSKTANYVLAAPNGTAGTPSFRALVAADIPTLGNITNAGAIGSTSGLVVSTTTSGVLTASSALPNGTTATTQTQGDNSTKVATTAYVDTAIANTAAGFNVHDGVAVATTTTIAGVYAAGSAGVDGGTGVGATITYSATGTTILDTNYTLAVGDRVLVKNGVTADAGTTSKANGIYVVTTAGTTGVATILTRATDYDNSISGEVFAGDMIFVAAGSTQAGTLWVMNAQGTSTTPHDGIKIGTDSIVFAQFASTTAYTGSNGVSVSGTVISGTNATTSAVGVASFPATQFSVSSGAVTVASLAGSVINSGTVSPTYGGTGVNNGSSTITIAGNVTHSGSFTQTFVATGNTSVTLPTTGTLATLAGSEALTNKTLNGLTVTSSTGTLTITNAKTLSVSNTLTLAGTDGSTLNIGSGGTLGSNAYTSTAYAPLASPALTGTPTINSIAGLITASGTGATNASPYTSATLFNTGTYTAAKLVIKMSTASDIEVIEMLIAINAAGNAYITQYGDVQSNASLATITATATGTAGNQNVTVTVTPVGATSTNVAITGTVL